MESPAQVEFRLLGPLEVREGTHQVAIPGRKPRALLTILLLNANHAITRDRLIDDLWGEHAPATASKTLQHYVSQLRKALGRELVVTHGSSYAIELSTGQLDLDSFERLLDEGRRALAPAERNPEKAAAVLREALALWRGDPFPELTSEPFAIRERARLEELQVAALEDRIEADLALGRHHDLVAELESLVRHYPLRERLWGQLMLALYRSSRQAEALAVYQEARETLVEGLGIEPGRKLHDLEQAILQQDPTLEFDQEPDEESWYSPAPGQAPVGSSLPYATDLFVGRRDEIRRLLEALDAMISGRGRLVMLAGEPGIGKSRTAAELARQARARGVEVLWGSCYEREGAPPYWPWVQAIRTLIQERVTEQLLSARGSDTAAIADLLPELWERFPDLEAAGAPMDSREARFRLFDSVAGLLTRAASVQPLLVVLDDLQWADEGSLLLLEFMAREVPGSKILLVGTYRDLGLARGDRLTETLAELTRQGPVDRIVLGGLGEREVGDYIQASTASEPPPGLVESVYTKTEGNPLFVAEVIRLMAQEGELSAERVTDVQSWSIGIPAGVREVIGRRLDRLSEKCNETLTVAAIVGREFELVSLSRLVDISEEEVLGLLDEALASQVIEELPAPVGRYAFTHALIQETLADELSTARRARLHARIAETFERLYGPDAEPHAAELAYHFAEAESLLGPAPVIRYSRLAGEQAIAAHAYEEALAHFERALAAKEGLPMDSETAGLLFDLARSELGARELFDLGLVLDHIYTSFDYYANAGDAAHAVEVAAYPVPPVYQSTELPDRIANALTMAAPGSVEEGRLLAAAGWYAGTHEGDYERARGDFERALTIARQLGDRALEARASVNAAQVDYWHLKWQGCREKGLHAAELAMATNDQHTEMVAREWPARAALVEGKPNEARSHMDIAIKLAERLRERSWLGTTHTVGGVVSMLEGDLKSAREFSDEGLALQPREPRNIAIRALIEAQLGETAEAEIYLDRLLDPARRAAWGLWDQGAVASFVPLIARITGGEEHFEIAEAEASAAISSSAAPFQRQLWPRIGLGLIAVRRADTAAAAEQYEWLEHQRGTAVLGLGLAVDRLLALLAVTMGGLDKAIAHFEDALEFCRRAAYQPEYAWTASDYAEFLLDCDGAEKRKKAISLQDEALAVARELGLRPLVRRVLDRRGT